MKILKINENVSIPEEELEEDFVRSSGPGGQNVNKVSSAVQLHFNIKKSSSLSENVRKRLLLSLKNQLVGPDEGELIVSSQESRSQLENRRLVREKLAKILEKALFVPKVRKKTKPTKGSQERRIDAKKKKGTNKKLRGKVLL